MYGTSRALPASMQAKYLADPRLAMAQELMKSSAGQDVKSSGAGVAKMLGMWANAYGMKGLQGEYQQRGKEYSDILSSAQNNPNVQRGVPAFQPGGESKPLIPAVAPGTDTVMANLMSGKGAENPDIQDYVNELQGKKAEMQMKNQGEIEQSRALYTDPQILAGKMMLAKASRPVNNINMTQEKEEDKAVGKAFGEQYVDLQKAGMAAPGKIAKYDRLNQLLDGVDTGTFKGTTTDIKAAAKGAGLDLESMGIKDDVPQIQAAQALTNAMALELRNPSGGAGMPGALSDQDRIYLRSMEPGIEKTREGRMLMTDTSKKLAQRDVDVAKQARDYRRKHGKIDEGFYDNLADYANKNPLFGKQEKAAGAPVSYQDYFK